MSEATDIAAELRAVREEIARRESSMYGETQRGYGRFPWLRCLELGDLQRHEERLERDLADLRQGSFLSARPSGDSPDDSRVSSRTDQARLTRFTSDQ